MSDVSEPDDDFSSSHKVVERPASPTQLTATFTASHTVQFTPHPHPLPSILEWRQSPVQQPQQDQKEGPMWDPACLASLACEETKSVYRLSTPPTPLLDEAMSVSPQKPSLAKERLLPVTKEIEVVTVTRERRKVQSRSDLLAQVLEQARITSAAKSEDKDEETPAAATPITAEPSPPPPSPSLILKRRSPLPHPKHPSPLLPLTQVMAALAGSPCQCNK